MLKFFRMYSAFIKQQIKTLIEYKVDFLLGFIALGVSQISTFLIILAVFTQIKSIATYSFDEVLLFFGYSQIIRGIDHIYNDNIWVTAWNKVRDGSFSNYLIRPINVITHIIMERFQFDGFGEVVIGLIIFFYAKAKVGLVLGFSGSVTLVFFILCGLAIYFAIKLATCAVSFWTVSSGEFMSVIYEVNTFTKFPLDIYKNFFLKNLLIYLLPFAIVSYFPIAYFLRDSSFLKSVLGFDYHYKEFMIVFIGVVSALFLSFSFMIWNIVKRYNATGS